MFSGMCMWVVTCPLNMLKQVWSYPLCLAFRPLPGILDRYINSLFLCKQFVVRTEYFCATIMDCKFKPLPVC